MSAAGLEPGPAGTGRAPAFRCAAAARDRQDPQLGSAPQARRWLLLEHPGPWAVDALAGSRIAPEVLDLLTRTALAQQARPLLIRRPGRQTTTAVRSWAVCYEDGRTRWGRWEHDDDLRTAAAALAADRAPDDARTDPLLLVCAHGLHDACCAIRGRPVAAALARRWPAETWECSHVGGDRFAPNVVVLPDGVYYGLLDAATAVTAVQSHLAGQVAVAHLRGMTRVPPAAQTAIAALHRRSGPYGARDVELLELRHVSPGRWRVELSAPAGPGQAGPAVYVATVQARRREPARLTCRAGSATPATGYDVVELTRYS